MCTIGGRERTPLGMQAEMLAKLVNTHGVVQLVEENHLPGVGAPPYIITQPFGTHLNITDTADLQLGI